MEKTRWKTRGVGGEVNIEREGCAEGGRDRWIEKGEYACGELGRKTKRRKRRNVKVEAEE